MDFELKDIIMVSTMLLTLSGVYWRLANRVYAVECNVKDMKTLKDELSKKVDAVIDSINKTNLLLKEHIAYQKGREDGHQE